jgi:organic radical activating enzyme
VHFIQHIKQKESRAVIVKFVGKSGEKEMKQNELMISERFFTLSGEGDGCGIPTVYIRVFGCNMLPACPFCDTKFSIKKIDNTIHTETFEDIVNYSLSFPQCHRTAFTGGEPMLYADKIKNIMKSIHERDGYHLFHFETNGLIYPSVSYNNQNYTTFRDYNKTFAVSPKFHAINKDGYKHSIQQWANSYEQNITFKFVYEGQQTVNDIKQLSKDIGGFQSRPIYIMPEGRTLDLDKYRECAKICLDEGWNFSIRLQCILWNDERGT